MAVLVLVNLLEPLVKCFYRLLPWFYVLRKKLIINVYLVSTKLAFVAAPENGMTSTGLLDTIAIQSIVSLEELLNVGCVSLIASVFSNFCLFAYDLCMVFCPNSLYEFVIPLVEFSQILSFVVFESLTQSLNNAFTCILS